MKRFRVLHFDFDTRATLLETAEESANWAPEIQELWRTGVEGILTYIAEQYGVSGGEQKLRNFRDLGAAPPSLVAFHNTFYRQARDAFVVGAYYPAWTSVCALGERVLNHLLIKARGMFTGSPDYKLVYRKKSFDDWDFVVDVLCKWNILLPTTGDMFTALRKSRDRVIHFNPEAEADTRAQALAAMLLFRDIVAEQFTSFGSGPWYIPADIGISFVRKAWEADPFVRIAVLPNCEYVGPSHELKHEGGSWKVKDRSDYPGTDVSDDEFIELFKKAQRGATGGESVSVITSQSVVKGDQL